MSGSCYQWLDVMRTLAIAAVVLCHVTESVYPLSAPDAISNLSMGSQSVAYALFTIGRLGVPIFCFLTGFLLLPRHYDSTSTKTFWKRKLLPLLITFWCWTLINQIAYCAIYEKEFSPLNLVLQLLMLKESPFGHMWYMPMIIGIYVMIPFVANALQKVPLKIIAIPFVLGIISFFFIPSINIILQSLDKSSLKVLASLDFTGGVYGLYVISGYLIAQLVSRLRNIKSKKALIVGLLTFVAAVSFIGCVAIQIWTLPTSHYYKLWYSFFFVITCSLSIFILACILIPDEVPGNAIWTKISIYSLGIYFIHFPLLHYIRKLGLISSLPLSHVGNTLVIWLALFIVSTAVALAISKIPKVSKILLLR